MCPRCPSTAWPFLVPIRNRRPYCSDPMWSVPAFELLHIAPCDAWNGLELAASRLTCGLFGTMISQVEHGGSVLGSFPASILVPRTAHLPSFSLGIACSSRWYQRYASGGLSFKSTTLRQPILGLCNNCLSVRSHYGGHIRHGRKKWQGIQPQEGLCPAALLSWRFHFVPARKA